MNKSTHFVKFCLTILFAFSSIVFAGNPPNPNVKYVGYDWMDSNLADNTLQSPNFRALIGHDTNMNVVRTIAGLNSEACKNRKCAFGIQAGQSRAGVTVEHRKDICPDALTYSACVSTIPSPWSKIWHIVDEISDADNKPLAIYFIDEPELNPALKVGGVNVPYSYSSFVCTLNQALNAYGLGDTKVFTILAYGIENHVKRKNVIHDVKHQMPRAGCSGAKSTPDWIGFNNYDWGNASEIYEYYNRIFPNNGTNPSWVIVPLATDGKIDRIVTSAGSKENLQSYWDLMWMYPEAPIVAYMLFRFNPIVTIEGYGDNDDDYTSDSNEYFYFRALLRYMSNRIAGP